MLRELHISGLGVIDDLDLELHPGLNVLTGETGTGKTMVTVGLMLALGRRGGSTLVREGARAARVQASFDAPPRAVEAGWAEDGEFVLARSVTSEGRSSARIGGALAPVSALAELAAELVEVHGQHQGQALLSSAAQTAFLDRFAGADHLRAVEGLEREHAALRKAAAAKCSCAPCAGNQESFDSVRIASAPCRAPSAVVNRSSNRTTGTSTTVSSRSSNRPASTFSPGTSTSESLGRYLLARFGEGGASTALFPVSRTRFADEPARHLPLVLVARGEERRVRPSITERHAKTLRIGNLLQDDFCATAL